MKRHKDAIAIQQGACNPSGIAHAIVSACAEIRATPGHAGTAQITSDSAVRLMVHQLAFICGLGENFPGDCLAYGRAIDECKLNADKESA